MFRYKRPKGPHNVHLSTMFHLLTNRPGRTFLFTDRPKNTNLVWDVEILLPVKFRWIAISGFIGEVEIFSTNQRPGRPFCFSDRPENTNLVQNIEILLPVNYRWIMFSGFRGDVENALAYQRPGRRSCFSDRPEKHKQTSETNDFFQASEGIRTKTINTMFISHLPSTTGLTGQLRNTA